jgi:ABC-2 type transport system ATP-binding protein
MPARSAVATMADQLAGGDVVCDDLVVGHRGVPVLGPVSVSFRPGVTAIVGRNGAGKSTLLRTLATLLRPIAGSFAIGERQGTGRSAVSAIRRRLGFVPQRPDFPSSFTVEEMLTYTAALQRTGSSAVSEALDRLDLGAIRAARIGELSGGQRQRAFLAQATIHQPPVLFLDEPTVGLDIPSRHEFKGYLRAQGTSRTVLFTTHLVDDLTDVADEILVVGPDKSARHLGSLDEIVDRCRADGVSFDARIASEIN